MSDRPAPGAPKIASSYDPDRIDREQIREVCDKLEERGFLDDTECARALAEGSLARRLYGPRRMKAELIRRGADEQVAERAVDEAFAGGEESTLRAAAERWVARSRWDREKLARHLERKGFSSGTILRIVGELESRDSGDRQEHR